MLTLLVCFFVSVFTQIIIGADQYVDSTLDCAIVEAQLYHQIKFQKCPEKFPSQIEDLLIDIFTHTVSSQADIDISINGKKTNFPYVPPEKQEEHNQKFYQKIDQKYSDLIKLESYSITNYHRLITIQLPELLAQYGLILMPRWQPDLNDDGSKFTRSAVFYNYFIVRDIKTHTFEQWGITKKIDILYADSKITIGEVNLNIEPWPMLANGYYGNIMVNLDQAKESLARKKYISDQEYQDIIGLTKQEFWSHLSQAENRAVVANIALAIFFLKVQNNRAAADDKLDGDLTHEAGHIICLELNDAYYQAIDIVPEFSVLKHQNKASNQVIHEEIDAYLTQIVYAKDLREMVRYLILGYDTSYEDFDHDHDKALQVIAETFIDYILLDCQRYFPRYGFKVYQCSINPRDQVIFQFADLLDRPQVFRALAQRMYLDHQKGEFKDDFSDPNKCQMTISPEKIEYWWYGKAFLVVILIVSIIYFAIILFKKYNANKTKMNGKKKKKK